MDSSNRKKFRLKRANEMRRLEEFTSEELEEIRKVKHVENDENENNNNITNNNDDINKKMENLKIK
jgi:hypothetical protein